MDQGNGASIVDCFVDMEDPRFTHLCVHKLIDIIVIAICAVICGADNWVEIAAFGRAKYDWLRRFLELPCGIPSHDTFGRVGMAEIRYVEGLLAFWDGLKQRFPHLLFDLVQRRDLASLARSLDMSRADHEFLPHTDSISSQAAQYGLSHWTPLSGTGVPYHPGQDYVYLSGLSSSFAMSIFPTLSYDPIRVESPADYPWDWLKRMIEKHRRARPFFRGDFHPLLDYIHSNQLWGAVQYHRSDLAKGMLLAFRRKDSPFVSADFRLHALDPDATYELTDADTCRKRRVKGKELVEKGLPVVMKTAPASRLVFYRRAR